MIPCGDIHHLRLTVTDVRRSRESFQDPDGIQLELTAPVPADG